MDRKNIILLTDSYKLSHYKQYPPGTETVYSYFESRKGAKYPYTVFFGLQYFLKKYLEGQQVTRERLNAARELARIHMGQDLINYEGWGYIIDKHNGKLPVEIHAVPEGTKIPTGNVMMTIENTDPRCYWLPNYLETLLVQVWYPSTVATISDYVRGILKRGLEETGDPAGLDFKLHDFGFRGVSSVESAGIGGLAHLVNFSGTDTLAAIMCGIQYYDSGVCGFSIPASEHSTITSWGREHEVDAFRNMLEQYPTGLVACVSDSYNIYDACHELWGTQLKDKILARDGALVIRPDSGPIVPTILACLDILAEKFGATRNEKGYKVLHPKVRLIQGDGCTPTTIPFLVDDLKATGWSLDNIAFGMGGGLLQKLDRDTQRFAFKCSAIKRNGEWHDIYKNPVGDHRKTSKRGRLQLVNNQTVPYSEANKGKDQLLPVFRNGECLRLWTLDEIRKRARNE